MKLEEIGASLVKSALLFPNHKINKEVILAWHELFAKTDFRIFQKSLNACCLEPKRKFFPTPGEVNAYVINYKTPDQFEPEEAWRIANEIALGVERNGQTKSFFISLYDLQSKPPMYLTLRSFFKQICETYRPLARLPYNPWGGKNYDSENEEDRPDEKFLRIGFLQEYKSRLERFHSQLSRGEDPFLIEDLEGSSKSITKEQQLVLDLPNIKAALGKSIN